jgi:hypothetical protein
MALAENAELRQQVAAYRLMLELLTNRAAEVAAEAEVEAAEGESRGAASARLRQTVDEVRRLLPAQRVRTRQPNVDPQRLRRVAAGRAV